MSQNKDVEPVAVLRAEHQVILRVIAVLERLVHRSLQGRGFENQALGKCVEFFRLFADACHHAKEEDLLFPVLESRGIPREGGPIGVMLREHQRARELTIVMGDALRLAETDKTVGQDRFHGAARLYIELLTNHIHKEDNILFNMGDQVINDDDRTSLCRQFCEVGCRAFEGKNREQLAAIATELESECGDA